MRFIMFVALAVLLLPFAYVFRQHLPQHISFGSSSHATAVPVSHLPQLTRYVDPFIGTAGDGNVFPGADLPFGMVQWSPDSTAGGLYKPGGYNDGDLIVRGFSLTHLSGAGCAQFGNFSFVPALEAVRTPPQPNGSPYSDRFVAGSQIAAPGYYGVRLKSGIQVALTVTHRTGMGMFVFPRAGSGSILIDAGAAAARSSNMAGTDASSVQIQGADLVTGSATSGHFCGLPNTYTVYFAARFSRPFAAFGTWQGSTLQPGGRAARSQHTGAFLGFDTRRRQTVLVKVGLSYVSVQNALANLRAENEGWSFNRVRGRAHGAWNQLLNRVEVGGGTPAQRRTFYTALYHALLFPSTFSDADGHYMGFDGKVHSAPGRTQYANFSGWDIYRSEVPLLAWLAPKQTSDMMQSLVNDAAQGGWLPKWPVANGYTGEMDGDSADPMLAAALAFGARQFDRAGALRAMLKGATQPGPGPKGYRERPGLQDYQRLGYTIPAAGEWGAAAETLEYETDDFAIAQFARSLGDRATSTRFMRRAGNWRLLWDARSSFLAPRYAGGTFPLPLNPLSAAGYVEGNAYHYLWMVPFDLHGLFAQLGGPAIAAQRLDQLFAAFGTGPDQPHYWAGNEPEMEVPWEYDFAGRPWRTQAVVRRIETTQYNAGHAGLPGNDDLGALSSWYVWAAMGLYPEIPGVAGLAVGSPLFPRITLHTSRGVVHIEAPAAGVSHPYVQSMRLNGKVYRSTWLPLSRLTPGSTISFGLGDKPNMHAFG
jgi:predicted alpha-1,2-mannosidase